jgi:hypothetical protein
MLNKKAKQTKQINVTRSAFILGKHRYVTRTTVAVNVTGTLVEARTSIVTVNVMTNGSLIDGAKIKAGRTITATPT